MRAINRTLLSVFMLLISWSASAREEDFAIFQFRQKLNEGHQILYEYIRRDRVDLFQQRYLDFYRVSWGGTLGSWNYLLGGGYVDFEKGADEKRAHQFFIKPLSYGDRWKGLIRLGLEERTFIGDEKIHLRGRVRGQVNFLTDFFVGPSFYDEIFYVHDGQGRFTGGFNENRTGVGLRAAVANFEFFVFHVSGYLQTPKSSGTFEWLQLQTVFSF